MAEEQLPLTPLLLVILLVMVGLAIVVVLVSSLALQRIARERDKLKTAELEHQRKLLANSLDVQERERKRIAADLHDELSSKLSVARLTLYRKDLGHEHLRQEVSALVDQAITTSRNISYDLYPPLLAEFGLVDTLRDYIHPLRGARSIDLNALSESGSRRLEPNTELHLFRIAQELINNALKHSGADAIILDLRVTGTSACLRVADNGAGFDTDRARSGWGMRSLESRVQVLNGRYRIVSKPGKGTSALVAFKTTA